ncbi:putative reverse transcriptase domain-containing protein [Tanacetum coccineum]
MRQHHWLELLSDYDCEIRYHPGKANVVADTLSMKERIKPLRVRALVMTIGLDLPKKILEAQTEQENQKTSRLKMWEKLVAMLWSKLNTKNHLVYWCNLRFLNGSRTILPWILSPNSQGRQVVMIPFGFASTLWRAFQMALGTRLDMSTSYHPQTDEKSERTIQTLEDMLRASVIDFGNGWEKHLLLIEFSYNNSYHASIKVASFEALYGWKCRSPVCWAEVEDAQLTGLEFIHKTTEKIVQIKSRIQAARDRQKSYTDVRKPLEFQVGDKVMLKVSPWKGVIHFDKRGKLNPMYIGLFKVLAKVGTVAYRLE